MSQASRQIAAAANGFLAMIPKEDRMRYAREAYERGDIEAEELEERIDRINYPNGVPVRPTNRVTSVVVPIPRPLQRLVARLLR